ncbi:MAG: prepilin-type N-terminal cleavage/methylation domain-containing protein [Actinobacteria bacterium]|nr:prepilin-type N-terminal cleavage/methylation domain-containing protein [Actinomycetota bacterium]
MNRLRTDESGMTLIEILVSLSLFAIVTVGFYQVLFSGTNGADTAQRVTRVSQEARLGFNRIVRDTREASSLTNPSSTSYNVKIDFNSDGVFENPNATGDYEDLTFTYDATEKEIRLNGETLMAGVEPVGTRPIFDYASNLLEYDWNRNGIAEWQEIDATPAHGVSGIGNNNGLLDGNEPDLLSNVIFSFRVTVDDRTSDFFSEAQIRNRR